MELNTRVAQGVTILDISGNITADKGAQELSEKVRELVQAGSNRILLDFKDVSYMDSTGVGSLVACYTTVCRNDGRLKLMRLNDRTVRVLEIVKLIPLFDIHKDEAEALRGF